MDQSKRIEVFEKLVFTKFNIYNGLFLNLPYSKKDNVGMLIPLLYDACYNGLQSKLDPQEILDSFFHNYVNTDSEKDKIDFMFKVIQFVERQVVLYDSVEEAAFSEIQALGNDLSIKDFFQLIDSKKNCSQIADKLSTFGARIVFTAHPTQFYPPSVLDIISRLSLLIADNKIDEINETLQQLGLTSLINAKKPTPLDEARNIIYYLRNVYYDAVGDLYSDIKENIKNEDFSNPNLIKLGFWPGGDRDGNPFVTYDITKNVADELRITLMKCYYKDVKSLLKKLTFKETEQILYALRSRLYSTIFDPDQFITFEEIMNPLKAVREAVINNNHSLYLKNLDIFIDKVNIFRTHFATLDIRQDHSIHKLVMEAILKNEGIISTQIEELKHEELIDILLHKNLSVDASNFEEDIIKDTILNISQLKSIQTKNGEEGCNRYIISNSEDVFSVLFVYALFRWCGWDGGNITFDIVPLFETIEGMSSSESTMQELFDIPEYRAHVLHRKNRQTMMLGFSDGTKDGGYLKANWSIFKTKEKLTAVCEKNNTKAIFFDGRGGPPARGGGKTHRFYAAQSREIANHEIQLTIQGQTITSRYGTKEQFINNTEQLLTAGLFNNFSGKENIISLESRQLLEELANLSYEKYTALKEHELFIPYLENKSTLKYYGMANIGSRPAKRGQNKKLELKDLRAISFVGSWSQLKQNVPGYFGTGTAIHTMIREGKLEDLKKLFHDVPIFKALVLNSMMSLSKSNFELTSYMQKDMEYKDFWKILYEEYELSKQMLLRISGFSILMEEEPISRTSIEIREKIVLPLLLIQQYALQKIGENSAFKPFYEKIVTRSLYGNINASRNSV
ncbi:MAG: phosphoenolpyruvate carboxylase [Bacteroidales bacterium]|nr:phosphoenolpyruvate carboxylase [Bacteroidales bacterium]